ncbi:MAG: EamA family transporter [Patescibacteria group bacterium]
MTWQIIISLRIITAYVFTPLLLKKITGLPARTRRLCWQFFFCAIFSFLFLLLFKENISVINKFWLIIAGVGLINSFACYSYWRAIDISLSKTALFTQADDIIAILLGFLFLNEIKFLKPELIFGLIICFGAASLLIFQSYKAKSTNLHGENNFKLILWVAGFSLIYGIAAFLMRYFAITGITFSTFLTSWYTGSFLGALIILSFAGKNEAGKKLNLKSISGVFILSLVIWLSMLLGYWTVKLVPITVFQPIFLVSELILPALLGLYIFKERKKLTFLEKIAFLLGLFGILLIGFSFR